MVIRISLEKEEHLAYYRRNVTSAMFSMSESTGTRRGRAIGVGDMARGWEFEVLDVNWTHGGVA